MQLCSATLLPHYVFVVLLFCSCASICLKQLSIHGVIAVMCCMSALQDMFAALNLRQFLHDLIHMTSSSMTR